MGKTSNKAKDVWNASRYTQVKVSVKPDVASSFKAACKRDGVSMARDLSEYMHKRGRLRLSEKPASIRFTTRRDRRAALSYLLQQIECVRSAEEAYLDRIPDNLSTSKRYEDTQTALAKMEEVLDLLTEVYEA
jgi:hypothetical protein